MKARLILCAALLPCSVRATDPPAWLPPAGKDQAWLGASAGLRASLKTLDPANKGISRWLPRLKARCEILGQFEGFDDFKRKLYLEQTAMMARDLAAGRGPFVQLAGRNVPYVYWSSYLRDLQGTRFVVPKRYDPAKEYQVFLYYKLGGGLVFKKGDKWVPYGTEGARFADPYQPTLAQCLRTTDTFHTWSALSSQVKGRMGQHTELIDMPRAFCADFLISPDRIFLSGFSDGGYGSLFAGFYYPHLVAGIAPGVANWQYTNVGQVGLWNVPTLVLDGWGDAGYVPENFARIQTLRGMGYPIQGLFGHNGHSDKLWATDATFFPMIEWARKQRRDLWPKRIRYATWNLHWHRAYWMSIRRMTNPALAAIVDAKVDGNTITIAGRNVAAVRLALCDRLVDMKRDVQVVANGKTLYEGPARAALDVDLSPPPKDARWLKSPDLPGGITVAVDRSTYIGNVHGTRNLSVPGREWITVGPPNPHEAYQGLIGKRADHERGPDQKALAGHNLLLVGTPSENPVLAKVAAQLPVKFEPGRFSIGSRVFDKPEHAVRFVYPSPWNPAKYVFVAACNDPAAARKRGFFGLRGAFFRPSAYKFREGDCVVYGEQPPEGARFAPFTARSRTLHYTFTTDWRVPSETPIGQAERYFDFESVQVLTADAIKDACGVDVGLVSSYPSGYAQWRGWLPAGPVTFNDIATLRMLPEFIVTAKVTGKQLRAIKARALAVAGAESIEDGRTYTLAADYSALDGGALCYSHAGTGWRKIPNPIRFRSMADLQKQTAEVILHCSDLKQIDLQVTEVLVQYIRRHKSIAPRPFTGDLTKFITNPRAHAYPSLDWLHAHIPFASQRDTLHIGLAVKDTPPPNDVRREGSQRFVDVPAHGRSHDFRTLAAKLPATARFGVGKEADGRRILTIHLTNKGDRALTGRVILSAGQALRTSAAWPDRYTKEKVDPRVFGLVTIDRRRGKVTACRGAVFLHAGKKPPYTRIERRISYGFGLLAVQRQIDLPAHGEQTIKLLQFEASQASPAQVLRAVSW